MSLNKHILFNTTYDKPVVYFGSVEHSSMFLLFWDEPTLKPGNVMTSYTLFGMHVLFDTSFIDVHRSNRPSSFISESQPAGYSAETGFKS